MYWFFPICPTEAQIPACWIYANWQQTFSFYFSSVECYKQPVPRPWDRSSCEPEYALVGFERCWVRGADKALTPSARLKFSVLVREAELMQKSLAWCVVWNLWINDKSPPPFPISPPVGVGVMRLLPPLISASKSNFGTYKCYFEEKERNYWFIWRLN